MTGKRLLLTIGINDYPGSGADLRGCVNDSHDIATALGARGYQVTQLLDAQATWAAVTGILEGMVGQLRRGDRLVVHYSGHGTNIADRDGDESDGRDEALVMYDYLSGGLLLDDQLHAILGAKATGSRVLVLPDSCHSGTMQRFAGAPDLRATPADTAQVRFLDVDRITGRSQRPAPALPPGTSRAIPGVNMITGCDDPEFSYDASFAGRPNGAFTRAAVDTLGQGNPTLNAWYKAIRLRLPSERYPQTPQLQASSRWQRYSRVL